MIFNSIDFLIFFIAFCLLFFGLKAKYRWILLLFGSYFFYMYWKWEFIFIIIGSTLLDYICGLQMTKRKTKRERLPILLVSVFVNLSILFFFKYFDFFLDSINTVAGTEFSMLRLILPMGISFYTFQTLSYSIDVYQGKISAEKHLGKFAVYVTFFPQLVAGPIERAEHLLPQFKENNTKFTTENFILGSTQIILGLFKKIVVADLIAIYVNSIYGTYEVHTGFTLLFATYLFAIQIYCDFSGYSDIAIGTAKILGYDLMENFRTPYFSTSITEFWRRWHISLSTWLRDYLYIPLGGNKKGKIFTYRNLLITMLLGGLWHGASWNFVIWGALHGIYLSFEKLINYPAKIIKQAKITKLFSGFIVFNLVCLAWIFFRAETFEKSTTILQKIFVSDYFFNLSIQDSNVFGSIIIALLVYIPLEIFFVRKVNFRQPFESNKIPRIIAINVVLLFMIIAFGINEGSQFIYFQF